MPFLRQKCAKKSQSTSIILAVKSPLDTRYIIWVNAVLCCFFIKAYPNNDLKTKTRFFNSLNLKYSIRH